MSFPECLRAKLLDAFGVVQENRRLVCQDEKCACRSRTATKEEKVAAVEAAATAATQILTELSGPDGPTVNIV